MNIVKEIIIPLRRHFLIYKLFFLLSCLVMLLPVFTGSVTYAVTSSQLVHLHSRSTSIPHAPPTDCPDAPVSDAPAGPYLHFCSPKFAGDMKGPFGSHIVVFGGNFSSLPTAMYLTLKKHATQVCTPGPGCFPLTVSPDSFTPTGQNQFVYQFNWTFPVSPAALPEDFYLIAIYNKAAHQTAAVITTLAFTLLSSGPPCITVSDRAVTSGTPQVNIVGTPEIRPAPAGCASSQNIILAGPTIFIQGYNWLPGGQNQQDQSQQSVVVTATCTVSATCSQRTLKIFTAFPDSSGFFQQRLSLPPGASGNYQVTASNEVQEIVTAGGVTNTIASGALTSGGQGDNAALTLIVSSGSAPVLPAWRVDPTVLISLAALLLVLVSFVLSRSARRGKSTSPPGDSQLPQVYHLTRSEPRDFPADIAEMQTAPLEDKRSQRGLIKQARLRLEKNDFSLAIDLAIEAQCSNRAIWQLLLKAMAEVPAEAIAPDLLKTAANVLEDAIHEQNRDNALRLYVTAFIAYRLLLNEAYGDTVEAANLWYKLGIIYSNLPCGSLETYTANLQAAIACFQVAHQTYSSHSLKSAYAATLHNLGNVYSNLPGEDRQANLEVAIAYYKEALGFYTHKEHPIPRSLTNQYLGHAYSLLPGEGRKRQENLLNAQLYYEAAKSLYSQVSG